MNISPSLAVALVFATTLIVLILKERSLYVLFLAAYTHSIVVPLLYTHGYIGTDMARGLLLLKDILLFELFVWSLVVLFTRFRRPWPLPFKPLLVLTVYCGFRFLVGAVFLDDDWGKGILRMKMVCFPLEILVVVMVLTAVKPEFGKRFLRNMTYTLSILAVVAAAIFFAAPRDFWVQNANLAEYNADIKGDTENEQEFSLGLPGAATTVGARAEAFADIANFRAIGTFGDGLSLSFQMTVPVLLLLFYFPRNRTLVLMLGASGIALLCSLSRSGWLFCAVVATYVLLRRRYYLPFFILGGLVLGLVLFWAPMTQFAISTVSNLTPSAENADPNDSLHVEGLFGFYSRGFSDPGNILGKGMGPEAQTIPESGYAYFLEHFGVVAYASFLWFCIALYRQFDKGANADPLGVLVQGISLGILVVMHFSQYPLAFTAFISLWYIVGFWLSGYLLPETNPGEEPIPLRRRVPLGNASLGPSVAS
jgi:hypothetical protein